MQPVTAQDGLADVAHRPTLRLSCPECGVERAYERADRDGCVSCADCGSTVSKRLLVDTSDGEAERV